MPAKKSGGMLAGSSLIFAVKRPQQRGSFAKKCWLENWWICSLMKPISKFKESLHISLHILPILLKNTRPSLFWPARICFKSATSISVGRTTISAPSLSTCWNSCYSWVTTIRASRILTFSAWWWLAWAICATKSRKRAMTRITISVRWVWI